MCHRYQDQPNTGDQVPGVHNQTTEKQNAQHADEMHQRAGIHDHTPGKKEAACQHAPGMWTKRLRPWMQDKTNILGHTHEMPDSAPGRLHLQPWASHIHHPGVKCAAGSQAQQALPGDQEGQRMQH